MRHGLELPCGGEQVSAGLLVELGVRAEEAGWDGVFFEDYLVYYRGEDPPTFDPWVVLATIAARTSRIRVGTTVSGLLARDPVKLAREAATLGELAPGRVVLGVGLGDSADRGAARVGGPRGVEMDRRLDLLLDLLAGRPVGDGNVIFRPRGDVRVWVGGSAQAAAVRRRAAKADGIVAYKLTDTEKWSDFTAEEVSALRGSGEGGGGEGDGGEGGARSGRGGGGWDVAVGGRRRLPDLEAERAAIRAAADGGATWWLEFVHPGSPAGMIAAVGKGPVGYA